MRLSVVGALLLVPALAVAGDDRCVDVQFTPTDKLQIVAWIETSTGAYVDTLFVTQQIGSFGLGNRPGRFDFNSGPNWPYGRRITTFPVWSHKHGQSFPAVLFQNMATDDPDSCIGLTGSEYARCGENNLSHDFTESSFEYHYCKPLDHHGSASDVMSWDTGTCASIVYTDKGRFSTTATTGYPPRADLTRLAQDTPSVDLYKMMNPFDAVSQATPVGGTDTHASGSATLPPGDYVVMVEVAKEFDQNASFSFPPPTGIAFDYVGEPYRGQPSVLYRIPITSTPGTTTGLTQSFVGYGDPEGLDGVIRPIDGKITTDTPGSGAARLELVSDGGEMYRVRVKLQQPNLGPPPGIPANLQADAITSNSVSLSFVAPSYGDDHLQVGGYEIRIRASDEMTEDNFSQSMPVTARVIPAAPGEIQRFELTGLLPQTDYWIGVRAFDGCRVAGDLAFFHVTTLERTAGDVDACFVATAAYGSLLANDVEMLRRVRDLFLRTNAMGELGVEAYYTFGPALAGVIGDSDLLRATARGMLAPVVASVRNVAY